MFKRTSGRRNYGQDTDAKLVTLARARDDDAFTELIRRRHAKIRQYMRYLSGNAADSDDLAQQVLLRAWRGIGKLKTTAAFDGWLHRIMVTTWIDRAKQRKLNSLSEIDPDETPAPAQSQNAGLDLIDALATLPDGARLCVVLAYHDGYTHEEIAALTNFPVGTVKSHIVRGAARLRRHLEGYNEQSASRRAERVASTR